MTVKDTLATLAAAHPGRALPLPLDVTATEQIERAVEEAEAAFGRIDVLVNNAYDIASARLDTLRTTFDTWRELALSADYPTTPEETA